MCYYPYFRGKQYELITIRECANLFADKRFIPVIEPVKEPLSGLEKTLDILCKSDAKAVVVINPQLGDHSGSGDSIIDLLNKRYADSDNIICGVLLTEKLSLSDATELLNKCGNKKLALIHAGFSEAIDLARSIQDNPKIDTSIFLEDFCGKLYRKHFREHLHKILIRDGFQRRRNKDHPDVEFFSDLHETYEEENMTGFGDFLIVGDDYSETGGPAYAVAIHLTFIDAAKDNAMYIHHFKSDRQDTPQDPAGKFLEALIKLIAELDRNDPKIHNTSAVREFRSLSEKEHFPGLGYVKKLSMKHHLETLAERF